MLFLLELPFLVCVTKYVEKGWFEFLKQRVRATKKGRYALLKKEGTSSKFPLLVFVRIQVRRLTSDRDIRFRFGLRCRS